MLKGDIRPTGLSSGSIEALGGPVGDGRNTSALHMIVSQRNSVVREYSSIDGIVVITGKGECIVECC